MTLRLDWATHEAARYACENWHYSGKIPVSKLVKIGVWEDEAFIGVIIFGLGASPRLSESFSVGRFKICELVRVALTDHKTPVSRIVSIAFRIMKRSNPKLRLCVSFADPSQGHYGGIYQAGNWIYTGMSRSQWEYFFNGSWRHVTDVFKGRYGLSNQHIRALKRRRVSGKHRYVMPFDDEMRAKILPLAKPYPKREDIRVDAPEAEASMRPVSNREVGGSSPTPALQKDPGGRNGRRR